MDKISHIALFLPSLAGGGAERVMVILANALLQKGLSVDLVLVKAEGPYLKEVFPEVEVVNLNASSTIFSLRSLTEYLRKNKPQVIFSTLEHANVVALWAKLLSGNKVKCIIRLPSTITAAAHNAKSFRARSIPWLLKCFARCADAVIAVSHASAQDLATLLCISSTKIHVIYNPVISDELFEKAKEPLEHSWFAPNQPPVILGVGRLSKAKDFSTLIRAFALVRKEKPAKLMILGEGEERKDLEKLITKLGIGKDVTLPGFIENPYSYMKHAAVFVLSSRWEGLPNALIQATALEVPVVATNCPGGVAEIVEETKWGRLVPVQNVEKLYIALVECINDKKKHNPPVTINFRKNVIVEKYLELINNL